MRPTLTSYTEENRETRHDDMFSAQIEKVSLYTAIVGGPLKKEQLKEP